MKRLSAVAVFLLGASSVVCAQNQVPAPFASDNAAMDFAQTSASSQPLAARSDFAAPLCTTSAEAVNFSNSFASVAPVALDTFAPQPAAESAAPSAAAVPSPKFDPTQRYTRWQVGLGFAFVRFRSTVYTASAVGLNAWLSYSVRDWLAIEGDKPHKIHVEGGDKVLEQFADQSGGRVFYPYKVDDLAQSFVDIGEELRSQYFIAYSPNNAQATGQYRKIDVQIAQKGLNVRTRKGYYATAPTSPLRPSN